MKFYFHDWNNIMTDLKREVGEENISSPADADVVVMFADTRGPLREMAERSKLMGKKVYVLQHGRAATRDYQKPLNARLVADKFLAWGEADYQRMVKLGYGDRTVVVGCPLLKRIQKRVPHDEKNVLFVPVNADHEQPENILVYYELLKETMNCSQKFLNEHREELKKSWDWKRKRGVSFHDISGYTLIAKILPSHADKLYHGNVIKTHPGAPTHMDQLFDLLSNIDCLVSLDESTTEILAMAAGVPVVVWDDFKWELLGGQDYRDVELIKTSAAHRVPLTALNKAVRHTLDNPDEKIEERKRVVGYELGTDKGDPIQNILREIGFESPVPA